LRSLSYDKNTFLDPRLIKIKCSDISGLNL
jgi:hypothetical protein